MLKLLNAVAATLAVCTLALGLSQATAAEKNPLEGHYTLQLPELSSEIVLKEGGHFEYGLVYGGQEQSVTGTWKQTGTGVTLKADRDPRPPSFTFKGSRFSNSEDDQDSFNVKVDNKAMGLVFSGIDVEFQFKSGKTFKGQTSRSGTLGVQGPFGGDRVVRVGVAYQKEKVAMTWHDVKDTQDNIFEFEFEPGRLRTPFFEEMELRKDKGALVRPEGGGRWRYEKQ